MLASSATAATNDWFGVRVVDEATGHGVPLVELATVNHLRYVTDNAGWLRRMSELAPDKVGQCVPPAPRNSRGVLGTTR